MLKVVVPEESNGFCYIVHVLPDGNERELCTCYSTPEGSDSLKQLLRMVNAANTDYDDPQFQLLHATTGLGRALYQLKEAKERIERLEEENRSLKEGRTTTEE